MSSYLKIVNSLPASDDLKFAIRILVKYLINLFRLKSCEKKLNLFEVVLWYLYLFRSKGKMII